MKYRLGIDAGSTTIKAALIDENGKLVFSRYIRHNAKIRETLGQVLTELDKECGNIMLDVAFTGSIGMGVAQKAGLDFVQEVIAASTAARKFHKRRIATLIDIGGEDAKVVFFNEKSEPIDLRMNGNCAAGTGSFIDQMAIILGEPVDRLSELALNSTRYYPIASRCGVFCKTDIQNLIARNVSKEDIAASVFHAVAVQTVTTLAHGYDITTPVLFCGGPLSFIPALQKEFTRYLNLKEDEVIIPEEGRLFPAIGAAFSDRHNTEAASLHELKKLIDNALCEGTLQLSNQLEPLFTGPDEYNAWKKRISHGDGTECHLMPGEMDVYLGIDSGSTTTKVVFTDTAGNLLHGYYAPNEADPVGTAGKGIREFAEICADAGTIPIVKGSCSTGYGEDLIKAAYGLDCGIIETIAHFVAARRMDPEVSFILDIGGQDMKAIYIDKGVINRIEINEACSSGCGSFIETFAKSLGHSVGEFAEMACTAAHPCDLGTRCTVFMNSKVKQVLREGFGQDDISAGLAYSVIRNCLYKVMKLKNTGSLGTHIVVQGGTMKNDAVVRALEKTLGTEVSRSGHPELMGAYGCALHAINEARRNGKSDEGMELCKMLISGERKTGNLTCKGCENNCAITRYDFGGGHFYFSGNRCERVFSNKAHTTAKGRNAYTEKYRLLFDRAKESGTESGKRRIGIPRVLNMYEDFPFWHTLLTACGFDVVLSDDSAMGAYETTARMVMSDNICFPAKLVHSHLENLAAKGVERIFFPFVVYGPKGKDQNSYNCPIVSAYSQIVRDFRIRIDCPEFSMKDNVLFLKECEEYLNGLGVSRTVVRKAFDLALLEQGKFEREIADLNREILSGSTGNVILLAGRPYHSDPLIQHKVSGMIASMGVDVISDDIVRNSDIELTDVNFLSQWTYTNRILRAAKWCGQHGGKVQFVELTSFGCGPDAFLTDAVRDLLDRYGKTLTLLKLDDISNVGSMKLRVRSMLDSIRFCGTEAQGESPVRTASARHFEMEDRRRTILLPFFMPFISPLIPAMFKTVGYNAVALEESDVRSADLGLRYANNEVCYPATLVVGDIIKALQSGKYRHEDVAVTMVQTGGQCRASNYLPLIRKAMEAAGFADVPVISASMDSGLQNTQPGFTLDWKKVLPMATYAVLFADVMSKLYYPAAVRSPKGVTDSLKGKYLEKASQLLLAGEYRSLVSLANEAAAEFESVSDGSEHKKVGIVGEIYLKFNSFAHRNLPQWLMDRGVEIVPPVLTDFFVQYFVNYKYNVKAHMEKRTVPLFVTDAAYGLMRRVMGKFDRACACNRRYVPFGDIFRQADNASQIISLAAQFGEGWLLPGEIMSLYRAGIRNVLSLQPFGCIANHIVVRGIEKRVKKLCPDINMLAIDFDGGVSEVNIINRMLLFTDNLR